MKQLILWLFLLLIPAAALADSPFLAEGEPTVMTDTSYRSQSVALDITSLRAYDTDVYVVDLHLRSAEQLLRAYGGGAWGEKTVKMSALASENNALLALTGDSAQNFTKGWVIGNGQVLRDTANRKRDVCILYRSGEMVTLAAEDVDQEQMAAQAEDIWQCFLFGPALLDENGHAYTDFSDSNVRYDNPRAVIGYYVPGHYCLVQVDGRSTKSALEDGQKNNGMTLEELAAFMESLGCTAAYNLDGGRSAMLWYNGQVISTAADINRRIGDIIYICGTE